MVQLKLQQDLANTQEVALKLEAQNKEAVCAMQRMRADFKSQEEQREQLAADKVTVIRENNILKETVLQLSSELESLEARKSCDSRQNQQVHAIADWSGQIHGVFTIATTFHVHSAGSGNTNSIQA